MTIGNITNHLIATAVYIMVNGLGLVEGLDFGTGAVMFKLWGWLETRHHD